MALTYYHNPRCSKSRDALALLRDRSVELTLVEYLKTPPSAAALAALVKALGFSSARQLLRAKEAKDAGLADPALDEAALLAGMAATPAVIERPILTDGVRAVIGRPPEQVLTLL